MSNNWQDALAALRSTMPDDHSSQTTEEETINEALAQNGRLDIIYERKGRAGKCATIISGFNIPDDEIENIASEMKRKLGAGGSARGGEILIQGDRRQDILKFLTNKGLKARII